MTWQKIHPILHTAARYILASIFLMYAVGKIMGTQFSSAPSLYDANIGELSGFQLTWYFFGYSFWYGAFIATSQIIAAVLLFFRRTTRLGIAIYISMLANILVLDFAYGIEEAKSMAIFLMTLALFVFFSEYKAFFHFFLEKPPLFEDHDRPAWMNKIAKAKFAYIPLLIVGLFTGTYFLKEKIMTQNEFYGAWQPQEYNDWQRIYFQGASTFSIRNGDNLDILTSGKYSFDRENKKIQFHEFTVPGEEVDVLNIDSSHISLYLETDYVFEDGYLTLSNDTTSIRMKRLR